MWIRKNRYGYKKMKEAVTGGNGLYLDCINVNIPRGNIVPQMLPLDKTDT